MYAVFSNRKAGMKAFHRPLCLAEGLTEDIKLCRQKLLSIILDTVKRVIFFVIFPAVYVQVTCGEHSVHSKSGVVTLLNQ